ncbi:probable E3 ubiquitin-protein ligase HERC4 [Galendromus occidentalis]|uniref:Probable E3 ubiquitin-protein ligase HERC4 n=1 Tax=Galendromus occidentalis TaxID=34638 RepID=A0AAJ7WID4_9ACAR|nr:probable E3 ubiquitin-protein ligase HERC4 [Galendromus occidentalis]
MNRMGSRSRSRQRAQNWTLGFGNTNSGELGLGGIEDHIVRVPRSIPQLEGIRVRQIATGAHHTLVLTSHGRVLSCGSNDHDQLGQEVSTTKPEPVTALQCLRIVQVCCGQQHSMALTEAGQVYMWGSNSKGQLGNGEGQESRLSPRFVKTLAPFTVVQIACGSNHCLALLNNGALYAWGDNGNGQLGIGTVGEPQRVPVEVTNLLGLPLSQIACGANHSMVLSKSGVIFVWGSNRFGQLGLSDNKDRAFPTLLKTLRQQHVKFIAAGGAHSAALTAHGGVFTFGSGSYGQLGHGSKNDQLTPMKIQELMGTTITQIALGRCHTVCYAPTVGKVFTFGLGGNGQLGSSVSMVSTPTPLAGNWGKSLEIKLFRRSSTKSDQTNQIDWSEKLNEESIPRDDPGESHEPLDPEDIDMEVEESPDEEEEPAIELQSRELLVYSIFAGGDRSFLVCHESKQLSENRPADYRIRPKIQEISTLEIDILESLPFLKKDEQVPEDIMNYLEPILSSLACLNGSFLVEDDGHYNCTGLNHGIDVELAMRGLKSLEDTKNTSLQEFIGAQLSELLSKMQLMSTNPTDIECIRVFFLVPLCHLYRRIPQYLDSITNPYHRSLLRLKQTAARIVSSWFGLYDEHMFGDFVRSVKSIIDHVLIYSKNDTMSLEYALKTLRILNGVNREKLIVPFEEFYIEILHQHISIEKDYQEWSMLSPDVRMHKIFFCDYPFVFDAAAKTIILLCDAAIQKHSAVTQSMQQNLNPLAMMFRQQQIQPYLILKVRRDNIIQDSLHQLASKECQDLKKPLKVIFAGEDAVDEGGVRKEFFMLLIREILDPKFGMFTVYEDSQYMWFHQSLFQDDSRTVFLIGIMCGLAIYNQTIIPLPFPLALYKKLLREPVNLQDLAVLTPATAKGLQDLLNYDGDDVESVFCLNFTVTRDNYGQMEEIELKPGGNSIPVTRKNKAEYVKLYVDYLLNQACKEPFQLFSDGFYRVLKSDILSLFNANELMTLVAGKEDYDWKDLELHTGYKDEYNPTHPTIRMFWRVFHQLTQQQKKQFLLFLTGTDRIPILGMGEIKMIIIPYRASTVHLPVAHTCTNTLELPKYANERILKEKLVIALANNIGFGIR